MLSRIEDNDNDFLNVKIRFYYKVSIILWPEIYKNTIIITDAIKLFSFIKLDIFFSLG